MSFSLPSWAKTGLAIVNPVGYLANSGLATAVSGHRSGALGPAPAPGLPGGSGDPVGALSGENAKAAADAAAAQQRESAAQSQQIAWDQRKNVDDVTKNSLAFFNPANQAYQNLYGQARPGYTNPNTLEWVPPRAGGSLTTPGVGEQAFANYGQGLTQPTNSQGYYNSSIGQLQGPSAAESYFNPAAYQRTTNAQNFLDQNGSKYGSNTMQDAYQGLFNSLSGGPMAQSYGGFVNSLNNGAMQQALPGLNSALSRTADTTNLFNTQGYKYDTNTMQDEYDAYLKQQLDPSNGNLYKNFNSINSALKGSDLQEIMQNEIQQGLRGSNQLNQVMPGLVDDSRMRTSERQNQGDELIRQEQGPGATQSIYGNINDIYSGLGNTAANNGPGMYEQFVQGALNGQDPYYDRLSTEGASALDASINARGGFNSGAAMKAQGNFQGDLRAQQYSQLAGMAQGAQAAQQSRLGQNIGVQFGRASGLQGLAGQTEAEMQQRLKAQDTMGQELYGNQMGLAQMQAGWAQAAGGETRDIENALQSQAAQTDAARLARIQGQVGLGQVTDATTLQYLQQRAQAANMAASQSLASLEGKASLANMSDTQTLGRLTERGNLANMADVDQMNRVIAQGNITNAADVAQYNRTMGQGNLSNMAATQNLNYLNSYQNASMGADSSYLNLLQGGQQAANSASSAQLARIMGGGQLANSADTNNRANLMGYLGSANQAQGLSESRQQASLAAAMGLGGAQAGLNMQGGQLATSEYDRWMENAMGLRGNAAQLGVNAANQQQQQYWNLLGLGATFLGGPGAGAATQAIRPSAQTYNYGQPDLSANFLPQSYSSLGYNPFPSGSLVPSLNRPTW